MSGCYMCYQPTATVSPIFHDLRQEETILQIARALDNLNKISSDIFHHIKYHVENHTEKLTRLQERSSIVQAKVHKISGSNKATKVFSSSKYPGKTYQDYECNLQFLSNDDFKEQIKVKSKHPPLENYELKDKLQFFHVKYGNKMLRKNAEVTPGEGLGVLPNDLESVSSLLLFNTSENLYKQYVMSDPLGVVTKTRQILDDKENEEIVAAPLSLSTDQGEYKANFDYFYSPQLQEIPQLDVPLDLPDLPGIAGDLQYLVDSGPPLAPSVTSTPVINADALPEPVPISILPSPSIPVELEQQSPPSPPPLILPEVEPPTPSTVTQVATREPQPYQPNIPNSDGDARSNLMEAIRNAGGMKQLKSLVDRKQEAKRMKEEENKIPGGNGNLMADLHAKLAMRRKGISGTKSDNFSNPMEHILRLIEPPPVKDSETEEDDGEWEDE